MRRLVLMLGVVLGLVLPAVGADYPKMPGPIEPAAGDTIMFLGDSITHQCLYTQYVEDYFYTRYPSMRLHFYNAGVNGDVAADALRRFDDDVAPQKPRFVTVLLGMNDGRYSPWSEPIFDTYKKDMTTLIDRLQGLHASVILMTPTIHGLRQWELRTKGWKLPKDHTTAAEYNGVLAGYGSWVEQTAMDRGLGVVDLHSALQSVVMERRREDPRFVITLDSVHPNPIGHAVMAFTMLESMHPDRRVSAVTAVLHDGAWHVKGDGAISGVKGDASHLEFTFLAKALPWVLPADAKPGYDMVHAGHRLSNERVTVAGLAYGKYKLLIDGAEVGEYTSVALGSHVELQDNPKTPEYQQALAVATLNAKRNLEAVRPLRGAFLHLKGQRRKGEPDAAWMAKFHAGVAKLQALADADEAKIYEAAQPKPHRYELVAISAVK